MNLNNRSPFPSNISHHSSHRTHPLHLQDNDDDVNTSFHSKARSRRVSSDSSGNVENIESLTSTPPQKSSSSSSKSSEYFSRTLPRKRLSGNAEITAAKLEFLHCVSALKKTPSDDVVEEFWHKDDESSQDKAERSRSSRSAQRSPSRRSSSLSHSGRSSSERCRSRTSWKKGEFVPDERMGHLVHVRRSTSVSRIDPLMVLERDVCWGLNPPHIACGRGDWKYRDEKENLSKDAREQRARAPNGYVRCHKDSFILEQTILARGENIAEEIDHQIHENDAIASGNGNLNESSTIQGLSPERLHTLRRRAERLTLRMSAQVSESMDESLYHAGLYDTMFEDVVESQSPLDSLFTLVESGRIPLEDTVDLVHRAHDELWYLYEAFSSEVPARTPRLEEVHDLINSRRVELVDSTATALLCSQQRPRSAPEITIANSSDLKSVPAHHIPSVVHHSQNVL